MRSDRLLCIPDDNVWQDHAHRINHRCDYLVLCLLFSGPTGARSLPHFSGEIERR